MRIQKLSIHMGPMDFAEIMGLLPNSHSLKMENYRAFGRATKFQTSRCSKYSTHLVVFEVIEPQGRYARRGKSPRATRALDSRHMIVVAQHSFASYTTFGKYSSLEPAYIANGS